MIISKQNLQVVHVTRVDSNIPALDNVHIAEDGSTIGTGGRMAVIVSPVRDDVKEKLDNILPESGKDESLTVSADTVRNLVKDLPADKQFKGLLEHCNIKRNPENDHECRVMMTDGKRRRNITGRLYRREYVPYKSLFKKAIDSGSKNESVRLVLNLKRLLLLLSTIEKVAPDTSGDNPVWVEFTKENYIIIRGINMISGQRTIGIMSPYTGTEGKWLEPDAWERSFTDENKQSVKHKKKVMHKKRPAIKRKYRLTIRKK